MVFNNKPQGILNGYILIWANSSSPAEGTLGLALGWASVTDGSSAEAFIYRNSHSEVALECSQLCFYFQENKCFAEERTELHFYTCNIFGELARRRGERVTITINPLLPKESSFHQTSGRWTPARSCVIVVSEM